MIDPPLDLPSDAAIRALLESRPVIALVGASSKPERPSHRVMKGLLEAGYQVIPVNPRERRVHGREVFSELGSVPVRVDLVDVFRRAEFTPEVARQAVDLGARALWLQLGIVSAEAARIAGEGGLMVIMDRCTMIEHDRLIGRPVGPSLLEPPLDPGLCRNCRYGHRVPTPHSTFWLCRRSAFDPSFPKYPALPVLACRGHEPAE